MTVRSHIINKVLLELKTGRFGDVSSLQEDMSRLLWQRAVPQMESLFDRLVAPDEIVRIDRLELDLQPLDPEYLADDFVPKLLESLEQTLNDSLDGYRSPTIEILKLRRSQNEADWEIFLHFLRLGHLPWWSSTESWETWLNRWQNALQSDRQWQAPFRSLLASHPGAIRRAIAQFDDSFRHRLVLQVQPTWLEWRSYLSQAQQLLQALNLSRNTADRLDRQAWLLLFTAISQSNTSSPFHASTWTRQWLSQLVEVLLQQFPFDRTADSSFTNPADASPSAPSLSDLQPAIDSPQRTDLPEPASSPPEPTVPVAAEVFIRQNLQNLIPATLQTERSLWLTALQEVLPPQSTTPYRSRRALTSTPPASSPTSVEMPQSQQQPVADPWTQILGRREGESSTPLEAGQLAPEQIEGDHTVEPSSQETRQVADRQLTPSDNSTAERPESGQLASDYDFESVDGDRTVEPSPSVAKQPSERQLTSSDESTVERAKSSQLAPEHALEHVEGDRIVEPSAPETGQASERQLTSSDDSTVELAESGQLARDFARENVEGDRTVEPSAPIAGQPTPADDSTSEYAEVNQFAPERLEGNRTVDWRLSEGRQTPERQPTTFDSSSRLSPEEELAGLYVNQAGVVLLHPFLRPYFDDVGLLSDGNFQDSACQQTAVYLTHYLATRETEPPEYELELPKLLCGWPLSEPVGRLELPEAALEEAEHMLQAAINYWESLKSTSPDGLREGFLRREGKLTRTDSGWKLRVEKKAIDILLDRLPWGVSVVKLPWMDELLTVEWT